MSKDESRHAAESGWPDELYEGLLRMACRTMHVDFERRYVVELPRERAPQRAGRTRQ